MVKETEARELSRELKQKLRGVNLSRWRENLDSKNVIDIQTPANRKASHPTACRRKIACTKKNICI